MVMVFNGKAKQVGLSSTSSRQNVRQLSEQDRAQQPVEAEPL